jgi:hypothetical protein
MISVATSFSQAVDQAFSKLRSAPHVARRFQWGPIGCELLFTSQTTADAYAKSFLPIRSEPAAVSVSVAILTGQDTDLTSVVPVDASKGRTYFSESHVVVWHPDQRPVLYLLDRRSRAGVVWLPKGVAPEWELSRPACPLLHSSLHDTPWSAIHGAAVASKGRLLLLAGKGRAGKSTAALACARRGWDYIGDDYVCAETSTGRIEPLYASARLREDMFAAFSDIIHLSAGMSGEIGEKRHELRLAEYLGTDKISGGQLSAILIPRRAGAREPEFTPAARADAFQALFMQTTLGMPGPASMVAKKLASLVGLAPTYFVDTGSDVEAIPSAFETFLDSQ